jgi:hypothetical protein
MTPIYIFDLDGTLALNAHRQHLVQCDKPDWPAFFAACVEDLTNNAVIGTMFALFDAGAEVRIWSGRSEDVRKQTLEWFDAHAKGFVAAENIELRMRPAGDFTPDELLKESWLKAMPEEDRSRLVAVFDDRDKVVAMWRANGVACFQVAPGAF